MKWGNGLKKKIVSYWKDFSASQQISTLIFFISFTIFVKSKKFFYNRFEIGNMINLDTLDLKARVLDLLIVVLIAWIAFIIINKFAYFLDKLSSERIAYGLNYAFMGFSMGIFFCYMFIVALMLGHDSFILNRAIWVLIGISFSFGMAYTWYGSINLMKSLLKWLMTDEEIMKVNQKHTLVLTFVGVIISLIALIK